MEDLNFEQDTAIDETALDVEWLQQASLLMKYCRHEALCQKKFEQAEANYQITKAELDRDVRENPKKFDLLKETEGAINAAIRATDEYRDAKVQVTETQYEWNMAKSAVRSLYAKKDALENLVRLHGQQYFAGPSVPRNLDKEWEEKQRNKQANSKIKITRTKKK
jgi:hypothetical protein